MTEVKKTTEKKSMKDLYQNKEVKSAGNSDKKETKAGNAYRVLVRPLITEKATHQGVENKYIFEVALKANKIEVAKAIKEVYGVKPLAVNIIRNLGKNVRYGRMTGKRKDWKKAIVTLSQGETIKVYEGV